MSTKENVVVRVQSGAYAARRFRRRLTVDEEFDIQTISVHCDGVHVAIGYVSTRRIGDDVSAATEIKSKTEFSKC